MLQGAALAPPPHRFWPVIDNQLRKVAYERRVRVRLLVGCWKHSKATMFPFLRSLAAMQDNRTHYSIEVVRIVWGGGSQILTAPCEDCPGRQLGPSPVLSAQGQSREQNRGAPGHAKAGGGGEPGGLPFQASYFTVLTASQNGRIETLSTSGLQEAPGAF